MLSTMDTALGIMAYVGALGLTALASFAGRLCRGQGAGLPGAWTLVAFLCGVALWSLAMVAPAMLGARAAPFTLAVIALSPLPAAAFVHLVFAFALCGALRPVAWASYGVALSRPSRASRWAWGGLCHGMALLGPLSLAGGLGRAGCYGGPVGGGPSAPAPDMAATKRVAPRSGGRGVCFERDRPARAHRLCLSRAGDRGLSLAGAGAAALFGGAGLCGAAPSLHGGRCLGAAGLVWILLLAGGRRGGADCNLAAGSRRRPEGFVATWAALAGAMALGLW
jgi:hypothetical protein